MSRISIPGKNDRHQSLVSFARYCHNLKFQPLNDCVLRQWNKFCNKLGRTFYIFLHNMQLIRDIFDYIWTTWFWTPGTKNALGPNLDWINKWILNFKHNFLLYFATILVRPLGDFSRIQHVICNTDLEETQLGLYEVIKVKQAQYACVSICHFSLVIAQGNLINAQLRQKVYALLRNVFCWTSLCF